MKVIGESSDGTLVVQVDGVPALEDGTGLLGAMVELGVYVEKLYETPDAAPEDRALLADELAKAALAIAAYFRRLERNG